MKQYGDYQEYMEEQGSHSQGAGAVQRTEKHRPQRLAKRQPHCRNMGERQGWAHQLGSDDLNKHL